MARTKRTERVPGPAPATGIGSAAPPPALTAADFFKPPPGAQAEPAPRGKNHLAVGHVNEPGAMYVLDDRTKFLCGEPASSTAVVVAAAFDHPDVCPTCAARRPSAHGELVKVVAARVPG